MTLEADVQLVVRGIERVLKLLACHAVQATADANGLN